MSNAQENIGISYGTPGGNSSSDYATIHMLNQLRDEYAAIMYRTMSNNVVFTVDNVEAKNVRILDPNSMVQLYLDVATQDYVTNAINNIDTIIDNLKVTGDVFANTTLKLATEVYVDNAVGEILTTSFKDPNGEPEDDEVTLVQHVISAVDKYTFAGTTNTDELTISNIIDELIRIRDGLFIDATFYHDGSQKELTLTALIVSVVEGHGFVSTSFGDEITIGDILNEVLTIKNGLLNDATFRRFDGRTEEYLTLTQFIQKISPPLTFLIANDDPGLNQLHFVQYLVHRIHSRHPETITREEPNIIVDYRTPHRVSWAWSDNVHDEGRKLFEAYDELGVSVLQTEGTIKTDRLEAQIITAQTITIEGEDLGEKIRELENQNVTITHKTEVTQGQIGRFCETTGGIYNTNVGPTDCICKVQLATTLTRQIVGIICGDDKFASHGDVLVHCDDGQFTVGDILVPTATGARIATENEKTFMMLNAIPRAKITSVITGIPNTVACFLF
jgi:hypothetical protein